MNAARVFRAVSIVFVLCATAAISRAGPKDDVSAAIKRMVDVGNYSWSTETNGPGGMGGGGAEGKTADGVTELKLMLRDTEAKVFTRGENGVVSLDGADWQSLAEIEEAGPPMGMVVGMVRNYQPPAKQAANLLEGAAEVAPSDDGFKATLTPEAAKGLMNRRAGRRADPNRPAPEIKDAAGTVYYWLKDGALSKFEFHITGTMTMNGEDREIDRTTTVTFNDVGSTKVEVPEAAKAKLGS